MAPAQNDQFWHWAMAINHPAAPIAQCEGVAAYDVDGDELGALTEH